MREILFRARWKDTNKVVENFNEEYTIDACNAGVFIVEQFTGLLDKNGNKIFEGDTIKFSTRRYHFGKDKGLQTITFKSRVVFDEGTFLVSETQHNDTPLCAFNQECEIIGNIHENETHK